MRSEKTNSQYLSHTERKEANLISAQEFLSLVEMDSLSTTSLHEQLGVCHHKVSKPNPLRFSSNLPLIWMACLIRLYYPSVHSNVLTHSASLRYSFPTLLLSPSPATATDKHLESETIQISCEDLFFFLHLLICFACHPPILCSPSNMEVSELLSGCCSLHSSGSEVLHLTGSLTETSFVTKLQS